MPSEDSDQCPVKTRISLGIRFDQSSLSAWTKFGSLAVHWTHGEDSDQTRLICVFVGHTLILSVLSCHASLLTHSQKHTIMKSILCTCEQHYIYELCHEIMVVFILRKLILQIQTRMHIHPEGEMSDIWSALHLLPCIRTAKALVRLHGCAGLPEPSLVAYVIRTIISWVGSYTATNTRFVRNTPYSHIRVIAKHHILWRKKMPLNQQTYKLNTKLHSS